MKRLYILLFILFARHISGGMVYSQALEQSGADVSDTAKISLPYIRVSENSLTSSVSIVRGDVLMKNSVYSAGNALYGMLPGLFVQQGNGEPGKDLPSFNIRGRSTTAGTDPLILIDGIERDINTILVEDIESISVLKDAASAIVYGLRGANGVIMVNTKRGSSQRMKVNVRTEQNFLLPTRQPSFVNSAQFVQYYNQALQNDGQAPLYSDEQIANYEKGDPYYYPNVDWAKEVLKDYTWANRSSIDVSGGNKTSRYYVSAGYHQLEGLYKNTDMNEGYSTNSNIKNYYFRSNLDVNLRKNWTASLDLAGRLSDRNSPYNATATIWEVLYKYPSHLFPVYVQDNVYGGTSIYPNNPVGYVNSRGFRSVTSSLLNATVRTKYELGDFVKGLSASLSYSTDNAHQTEDGWTKDFAVRELLGRDVATGGPILSAAIGKNDNLKSFGPESDTQDRRNTFEATIQYEPVLSETQSLNTVLIYHQDRQVPNAESPYNFQFVSGKAFYGLKQRYIAELGFSYSGTEAFAKGHRFGFFPAVSAAWIMSEEAFMKNNRIVNFLKVRASAGKVGNASLLERFGYIRQYTAGSSYIFGNSNTSQSGLTPGVVGSDDFTWESSTKLDLGLDARLFNHLSVAITGFFERRTDILNPESNLVPDIFGGDLPNLNAGTINNRGIEAALSYSRQKNNWGYTAAVNVSYAANKIKYQPEVAQPYPYLYSQGHQIAQPFILEATGLFNSAEEIAASPTQSYGPVYPGDIKYKDQNNDGRIDDFDKMALRDNELGNWDLGMLFGINYKGFSLNATLQGQLGRDIYLGDSPYLFWPFYSTGMRISTYNTGFWTEETKGSASYPRLSLAGNANNYRPSTFWYVNGDFLRLRSAEFGYDLPKELLSKARIKACRFFLRGMNLFTIDHLGFADPETRNGYPAMKSYTLGLNLQF